ncbi:MAG: dihydroorotate dehydrogenase-like protein [Chloroflexi bacterium]|nr:dihydroorotate dehydrogenase-like protein [Chloroflexota bacterium]
MVDFSTTYLGIPLKNPLVVAASSLSSRVDSVKQAEEAGAGALVIRSLFEEQIQFDALRMENALNVAGDGFAEAQSYFPKVEHGGPKEHLMWVEKTRKAVKMPVFASLNAVSPGAWTNYARQLVDTGVDGLEVNFYAVATDPTRPGSDLERALFDVVESVRAEVKVPFAVKLSPFYTSIVNIVSEIEKRGANGVVLFNRFLQPNIDPDTESLYSQMTYSQPDEIKAPLRWIAILYGRTKLDLALSTGVHSGKDAIKGLLAGATVVQMAATLLKNGPHYLSTMLIQMQGWMEEHSYSRVSEFRGNVSQKNCDDPFAFERAQYVRLLLDQK